MIELTKYIYMTFFCSDPYEATDYKYSCPHFPDTTYGTFKGSHMWNAPNLLREDCLFLNIWTPVSSGHSDNDDEKLPVMVKSCGLYIL